MRIKDAATPKDLLSIAIQDAERYVSDGGQLHVCIELAKAYTLIDIKNVLIDTKNVLIDIKNVLQARG